jgi:hypothetical protein
MPILLRFALHKPHVVSLPRRMRRTQRITQMMFSRDTLQSFSSTLNWLVEPLPGIRETNGTVTHAIRDRSTVR